MISDREIEAMQREVKDLREGLAGIPVRWAQGGSTVEGRMRGKLASALTKGDFPAITSATFEQWKPASAAALTPWTATGKTFTIYDNGYAPTAGLAIGTKIQVVKLNGQWYYDGGC